MKRIGLTGNIGSGKSTIASCFKVLGISVFNSDDKAKFIMNNNSALKQKMINHFGENVFNEFGLNRKYLSRLAFNNVKVLKHILEWNYFLGVITFYLLTFFLWKKSLKLK